MTGKTLSSLVTPAMSMCGGVPIGWEVESSARNRIDDRCPCSENAKVLHSSLCDGSERARRHPPRRSSMSKGNPSRTAAPLALLAVALLSHPVPLMAQRPTIEPPSRATNWSMSRLSHEGSKRQMRGACIQTRGADWESVSRFHNRQALLVRQLGPARILRASVHDGSW